MESFCSNICAFDTYVCVYMYVCVCMYVCVYSENGKVNCFFFVLGGGKIDCCWEISVSSDHTVLHLLMDFVCVSSAFHVN